LLSYSTPGVGVADVVSVELELPVAELPGVGVVDVVSVQLELPVA
jgi:hypothetical protein